ncbi:cytochrome c biogenesis protein ResB [Pseudonocardia sp. MCCB 268]|nr:cytochrome c biogenesis protein ResB [Pseudonocardia cytotoxica]
MLPCSLEYQEVRMRQAPVATPRTWSRLPHYALPARLTTPTPCPTARTLLWGWRKVERPRPDGTRTISAEKGYPRETGNLVFHLSLIGILLGLAGGSCTATRATSSSAPTAEFCNSSILGYDMFRAGLRVDGTGLNEFCVRVDRFDSTWLPNGQPATFGADYVSKIENRRATCAASRPGGRVRSRSTTSPRTHGDRAQPHRLRVRALRSP